MKNEAGFVFVKKKESAYEKRYYAAVYSFQLFYFGFC